MIESRSYLSNGSSLGIGTYFCGSCLVLDMMQYIDLILVYWDSEEEPIPRWRERLSGENQQRIKYAPVTVLWIPYYAD
jgi:late competence protein required for DNA uptake (superfamily II DNA/RNA helicase)